MGLLNNYHDTVNGGTDLSIALASMILAADFRNFCLKFLLTYSHPSQLGLSQSLFLPFRREIGNLFDVCYKDESFQRPASRTSRDSPLRGLLVPSPCGAEVRYMVQRFYHPWMVLNCADPPSSPDTMTLQNVKQFHGMNAKHTVANPYKVPWLGVLTMVATTDEPRDWYLINVVLPAIPRRSQANGWG